MFHPPQLMLRSDIRHRFAILAAFILLTSTTCVACTRTTRISRVPAPPTRQPMCSAALSEHLESYLTAVLSQPGAVEIRVGENELNSFLCVHTENTLLSGQLWISPEGLLYSGQLGLSGHWQFIAMGSISALDERLHIDELEIELNGHAWPRPLTKALCRAANDALTDMRFPLRVAQLTLSEGGAILSGTID